VLGGLFRCHNKALAGRHVRIITTPTDGVFLDAERGGVTLQDVEVLRESLLRVIDDGSDGVETRRRLVGYGELRIRSLTA